MSDSVVIRGISDSDLEPILELNQAELPSVSSLDRERLDRLVSMADMPIVAEVHRGADAELAGFAVVLGPGADYDSENYAWFSARYSDFAYFDRVVVAAPYRRRQVGRRLYAEIESRSVAKLFCLEVNTEPRNEASLEFHDRLGFSAVGELHADGGAKKVVMLAKTLEPSASLDTRRAQGCA